MQFPNSTRKHRTALFIDAVSPANGAFQERVNRLLQSVNGSGIKTDIHVVSPGSGASVQTVTQYADSVDLASTSADAELDVDALKAWAKGQGYDQVLISVPA